MAELGTIRGLLRMLVTVDREFFNAGSNPVLTAKKNKVMKEALKIIFLFKKPTHDDFRLPYTIFGIIGWLEVVSILIALIK